MRLTVKEIIMHYLEIVMFVVGVVLLVYGYRKNNRNILLTAAITLFVSAGIESFAAGVSEGIAESDKRHATG